MKLLINNDSFPIKLLKKTCLYIYVYVLFMATGKLHVLNIRNTTAALFLFTPTSVISVLLLKGKISKSLNLWFMQPKHFREQSSPRLARGLTVQPQYNVFSLCVFEKVINDGHGPLWSKRRYLFIGQTGPSQSLLCLYVKPWYVSLSKQYQTKLRTSSLIYFVIKDQTPASTKEEKKRVNYMQNVWSSGCLIP